MHSQHVEELHWTRARLQDRISLSGWFLSIVVGLLLWALLFSLIY